MFARRLAKQFASFAAVGAIGTAVQYTALIGLVNGFGVGPVLSSTLGALGGAITNYLLNYSVTFKSNRRHREAFWRFMVVATTGLGINGTMMALFVGPLELYYLPAQVITTGVVLIWNFLVNRFWTFREIANDKC